METSEKIVEHFVRLVKRWYTISNLKGNNNKEVDIICMDDKGQKHHIEVGISIENNFILKGEAGSNDFKLVNGKKKWSITNSVDYYLDHKFNDPDTIAILADYGIANNYEKIIVTWSDPGPKVINYALIKDIKIWVLQDMMKEMERYTKKTGHTDDVIRMIQLC
jgi:hypothetical protein